MVSLILQMYTLLSICLVLHPQRIDESLHTTLRFLHLQMYNVLGDPEVTANLYSNFAYLYWEGCVICSI